MSQEPVSEISPLKILDYISFVYPQYHLSTFANNLSAFFYIPVNIKKKVLLFLSDIQNEISV